MQTNENIHKKTIVLPQREEMFTRLNEVDLDNYAKDKFFPLLLKEAGNKKVPMGVIILIMLAIHDYADDLGLPFAGDLIMPKVPEIIKALITDEEIQKETLAFYEEVVLKVEEKNK
jgi:hypothetical protein